MRAHYLACLHGVATEYRLHDLLMLGNGRFHTARLECDGSAVRRHLHGQPAQLLAQDPVVTGGRNRFVKLEIGFIEAVDVADIYGPCASLMRCLEAAFMVG